jgi:hypothetical protein
MTSNSSPPPFLGRRNLVCAPSPAKSCSTSSHVEFWYWERSKKDMLGSLWLKLVTFWWRRHTMADAAPRILSSFFRRPLRYIRVYGHFFHSGAWVRWSPFKNRPRRRGFPDCWVKASLLFDGIPVMADARARDLPSKEWSTWISSDCWQKCECRTSNKRARPVFFFSVVLWVSLLREPSVLEKKKRSSQAHALLQTRILKCSLGGSNTHVCPHKQENKVYKALKDAGIPCSTHSCNDYKRDKPPSKCMRSHYGWIETTSCFNYVYGDFQYVGCNTLY